MSTGFPPQRPSAAPDPREIVRYECMVSNADALRVSCFVTVFATMAIWELLSSTRALTVRRARRWPTNVAMLVLGLALVRVAIPLTLAETAQWAGRLEWGLLHAIDVPVAVAVPLAVVVLDLVVYAQHVIFHRVPLLWRVHRVHHADTDVDVTTGLRFHPIELLLSAVIKTAVVVALGAPALAVVTFEVLLNATSMVTHGNVALPRSLDLLVRRLFVTPDMHRLHHSVDPLDHGSNFGFSFSVWDRIFDTYRRDSVVGTMAMTLGLGYDSGQACAVGRALRIPFH